MRLAVGTITIVTGLLLILGLTMLHSLAMHHGQEPRFFVQQTIWLGIGVAACTLAAAIDYRKTRWAAYLLLAGVVALLIVTRYSPWAHRINGAYRWLRVGGVTIQPSELAKLALILALAAYAHAMRRRMREFWMGFLVPGAMAGVVLVGVLIGKDLGTTALLALLAGGMLFVAGVRPAFLIPTGVVGAGLLVLYLATDPVRRVRWESFVDPEAHADSGALQTIQSMVAIGSGGTVGRGLGNGIHKSGFVPEQQTDFILSVIGEELGLRVTLPLLASYLAFLLAGFHIARRARDMYGAMLASGISLVIGLQAVINVAVTTGAMPNKGLALPFVSYGGSCLVTMLTLVGLLINVAIRSAREEADEDLPETEDREASALQTA